jgi:superfamily II DNA or RNA helicase
MTDAKHKNPYIVDNSISGWTALEYLRKWTEISKAMDIATGYFEIGSLLELDSHWQKLGKIRILMGSEVTKRTHSALLESLKKQITQELDRSLEAAKIDRPLLSGVAAIVAAIQSGQIEIKVYDAGKFHAKCYITYSKLDVIGSYALVGSSNFTKPGLTDNVELNVSVQTASDVDQLQEWFEHHWKVAKPVSADVLDIIERHMRLYTPFDVYAKSLHEFFRGHDLTSNEWEETKSKMFPVLDRYQKEAYWSMVRIAQQHSGAFLCDGVGLGKTFVGLMLIERLVLHENKRVVLFAPKAAREAVWDKNIKKYLNHIGGDGVFSNLIVYNHTDLTRPGFAEKFSRVAALADAVIIDEAHHFRNTGQQPNPDKGVEPSRYYRMFDILGHKATSKQVFLLTATPINNGLSDFRRLVELFSQRQDNYFARTIGINSIQATFNTLERDLRKQLQLNSDQSTTDRTPELTNFISQHPIFQQLVVQRSRAYARESQLRENKNTLAFPTREAPVVAQYSLKKSYGQLFNLFEAAFKKDAPLFKLPLYDPTPYLKNSASMDDFEKNRLIAVVGLIRTGFLKRFESSIVAFELSCIRLLQKLLAFVEVHNETDSEKHMLHRWQTLNHSMMQHIQNYKNDFDAADEDVDEDFVSDDIIENTTRYSRDEYAVDVMLKHAIDDIDVLVAFLRETMQYDVRRDDKIHTLIELLRCPELANQKVLIFSEFADTARYIARALKAAGIQGVDQVDSASKQDRARVIERFAPYYNELSTAQIMARGDTPTRVLISTDVLAEGLNLQDAVYMMNYDIHWNPVRLMQRIGRVDRRLNPAVEAQLVHDHPETQPLRGKVKFWNFLPPQELHSLLTLYKRVTNKTLIISEVFGIEGKQLLTPEDNFNALMDFNAQYEGTRTAREEMLLEYQSLLTNNPTLEKQLQQMPTIHSGKTSPTKPNHLFFCYALPAYDPEKDDYTLEAGTTRWYLYTVDTKSILSDATEIVAHIRATSDTPRVCVMREDDIKAARTDVEKEIKQKYLRNIDAPQGVKAVLRCWMELS